MIYWLIAAVSVALIVLGDDFLKQAAVKKEYLSLLVIVGSLLYAVSAPLWVYVMQTKSLAQVGIMYTTLTLLGLYALGWLKYSEVPTGWQLVAIPVAILAAVLSEL